MARYVEHFYRNGSAGPGPAASAAAAGDEGEGKGEGEGEGGGGSAAGGGGGFVAGLELWIVFRDEGASLRRFLYSPRQQQHQGQQQPSPGGGGGGATRQQGGLGGRPVLFEPSEFWRQLRTAEGGPEVIRGLMRQIVEGAAEVHKAGAAHRDLKPSNIILSLEGGQAVVKIADFR